MKVLFYHSTKKTNKQGLAPICCRITISGSRIDFSTGIYLASGTWQSGSVCGENGELYNGMLAKIRTGLTAAYLLLEIKNKHITAAAVKNQYLQKNVPNDLIDIACRYMDERKGNKELSKGTLVKDKNYYAQLREYLKYRNSSGISISEINNGWGFAYINYLRSVKGYGWNHIYKSVGFVKQVLTYAVIKDYTQHNPILLLPVKKDKAGPIVALSEKELLSWKQWRFASKRLQEVADLYLFQCATGFSYIDVYEFSPDRHIVNHAGKKFIVKERGKNGLMQIVPLFFDARVLIKKYGGAFPVISNQKYNAYLKEIADILGIEKKLTTHTARKTFGTLKLNNGWSIESVARMLGHANTQVTQSTYAQVGITGVYNELVRKAA